MFAESERASLHMKLDGFLQHSGPNCIRKGFFLTGSLKQRMRAADVVVVVVVVVVRRVRVRVRVVVVVVVE